MVWYSIKKSRDFTFTFKIDDSINVCDKN